MTSKIDLVRLRRAYELTLPGYNDVANITFHYELCEATQALGEDDAPEVKLRISEFWMKAVAKRISDAESLPFNASQLDMAIELFDDETVLSNALAHPDNAHYLACICMERTKHAVGLRAQGPSLVVRYFLERWSGKDVEDDVLTNLESTAKFLYGPAVWALYASEVKKEETIPAYFAALKLPLVGVMPNPGNCHSSESLPYDLS